MAWAGTPLCAEELFSEAGMRMPHVTSGLTAAAACPRTLSFGSPAESLQIGNISDRSG